jgi:copper chaperone NosL
VNGAWLLLLPLGLAACAPETARPIEPRLGDDGCAQCRMTLVSIRTAAQVAAPGAEPIFFDDLGCLRDYLQARALPADAVVFIADHHGGGWHDAREALLTRTAVRTPMGSGVIAHADRKSRDEDPDALHGEALPFDWLPAGDKTGKGGVP